MIKAKDVDEYIKTAPLGVREKLNKLRSAIKQIAPDATEKISYGMPYYSYKGRLCYYSYFKSHIGLYAMPQAVKINKLLIKKHQTGKATLRFSLDEELPIDLIKTLLREGVKQNESKK